MNGKELQQQCRALVQAAESKDEDVVIAALALAGEAGEVANDVKKMLYGRFDRTELRQRTIKELRDNLWYISCIANTLDLDLDKLMEGVTAHIGSKILQSLPVTDARIPRIARACALVEI